MNEEEILFEKAKEKWGLRSQFIQLAEESGELGVATLHLERSIKDKVKSWESFAEEIADVEFMLAEMRYYFPWLDEKVAEFRRDKRVYLEGLLKGVK